MELNSQQKAVVENRGGQLLVAAAAGSGKTSVLVERMLQRVDAEEDITDFVVITFTKEAAGELKQRIALELNRRLAKDIHNRHLRRQLTLIYQAKISTIHSFCSNLIREHGHLMDITPSFAQCSDGEEFLLKQDVVNRIMNKWYEKTENTQDNSFISLVNTLADGNNDLALEKILLDIHSKVQSHADPVGWLQQQQKSWGNLDDLVLEETEWGRLLLGFFQKQVNQGIKELNFVLELCDDDEFVKLNYAPSTEEVLVQFTMLSTVIDQVLSCEKVWDDVVELKEKLSFPSAGRKNSKEMDEFVKKEVQSRRTMAYDRVRKYEFGGTNQREKEHLKGVQVQVLTLIELVLDFSLSYQLEKESRNLLDYNDLEHFAVKLLVNSDETPTDLAISMGKQHKEVMVDEYQDTNRVQNAIFNAITEQGKKLFLVGDMKQAIYRFRLADPTIFTGKFQEFHKESLENPAKEGEARALTLSKNFRSRVEVLDSCNDFFADVMSYDFGEVNYREDGMLEAGADFPPNSPGYYDTELNIIDLEGYYDEISEPVDQYFAEARWVAKKIRTMVDDKFQVSDKSRESLRDVRYSDFMLLLRSKNALSPHYVLAFAEQNIPFFLKEGQNIFQSVEVDVALSLLKTVDNPRQDVALISVLRSPLFGFRPDDLALLKGKQYGCFYESMKEATLGKTQDDAYETALAIALEKRDRFLEFLDKKREEVREKTPQQLLWSLYEETNMLGIYGGMPAGQTRQDHLLEFFHIIGSLERGGSASLFACLQQLEKLSQGGKLPGSPNNQREGEAVVIHSIHSSKGLEKPVVILAGLSKKFNMQDLSKPVLFHQNYGIGPTDFDPKRQLKYTTLPKQAIKLKQKEESVSEELRLLYVAMTRAKEKLILSTTLKKGRNDLEKLFKGVTKPLNPTLLLEKTSLSQVILTYFLTRLEEGLFLYRWVDSSSQGAPSLDPNFSPSHTSRWKLNIVDYLDVETNFIPDIALEIEEEQADMTEIIEKCRQWYDWNYEFSVAVSTPSKLTATETKGRKLLDEPPVEEESDKKPEENIIHYTPERKPSFAVKNQTLSAAQRGTAIHLLMEYLEISPELDCSLENIRKIKDELLSERKITQAQYEVMSPEQIVAFLDSPWGLAARQSSTCHQEFKFSLLMKGSDVGYETEEKMLLQGVVDCWYLDEHGEIVLIDFKSDKIKTAELGQKALEHRNQMRTYSSALKRITGKSVSKGVLWFFDINEGVVVP